MMSYFTRVSRGYAMLEVLISILVIAFGLLGLAGMQGVSLRNAHSAYLRNQATMYAYEIADRMRANRAGYVNGDYHLGTATYTAACHPSSSPSGCTFTQMAQYDLWVWNQLLDQLPGDGTTIANGAGVVCLDSTPDDGTPAAPACDTTGVQYVAKIWWDDSHDGSPLKRYILVFQP